MYKEYKRKALEAAMSVEAALEQQRFEHYTQLQSQAANLRKQLNKVLHTLYNMGVQWNLRIMTRWKHVGTSHFFLFRALRRLKDNGTFGTLKCVLYREVFLFCVLYLECPCRRFH